MHNHLLYIPVRTDAMRHCAQLLQSKGFQIASSPVDAVTHLVLPVPTLQRSGKLPDGQDLQQILQSLPGSVTITGGKLDLPFLRGYNRFDLLKNETYLAQNAAITAECAVRIAVQDFPATLAKTPVLVLGWGRIGKCLARLLRAIGCDVSVVARKEADLAMLSSLGYRPVSYLALPSVLSDMRIIFNTVPAEVLPADMVTDCLPMCRKIDLASVPGIGGSDVIWATGLPGKIAPETSGRLIGQTILDYLLQEEVSS